MNEDKSKAIAIALSIDAVRLIRWLRAADPAPALSGPEASAMGVIVHSGGISPSALAEIEQVRRPTVTGVVNGLISRGLVRRARDPRDGRGAILQVTPEGERLWAEGQERRTAPLARRIAELPPDDWAEMERLLPLLHRLFTPPLD